MVLERHGVRGSEYDGVFFTEAPAIEGARIIAPVNIKIGGQNKDIRDIKRELAKQVRSKGGNALVGFSYGQRGNPWYQSFGLFDSEHWFGSGTAVLAPAA
jgi:hypothetical protein